MSSWKLPPRAKVFEALTAVADGRVRVVAEGRALVTSSSGRKTYTVEWTETPGEPLAITANDNASYWQGYLGYPIVAVLLATGRLTFDPAVAAALGGVAWKELNRRVRNDYEAAIAEVLGGVEARGVAAAAVEHEVARIAEQLASLALERPPRRARPPKGD
jgi:hypothetical protein